MDTFEQLTFKQQKFCTEYLISFNAYRSAIIAGYSVNSARKCELLHIPKIQAYLKETMNKSAARAQITHDRILREYEKIAFSSMGDYFDERGVSKQMVELTYSERAVLSYYEMVNTVDDNGFVVGEKVKIKLHNKMAALDKIARHTGFFNAKADKPITMQPDADTRDTEEDLDFEAQYGTAGTLPYELSKEVADEAPKQNGIVLADFEMAVAQTAAPGAATMAVESLGLGKALPEEGLTLTTGQHGYEGVKNYLTLSPPVAKHESEKHVAESFQFEVMRM